MRLCVISLVVLFAVASVSPETQRRYFGCRDDHSTGNSSLSLDSCYNGCAMNDFKFAGAAALNVPAGVPPLMCYCYDPVSTPNVDDSFCSANCPNEPSFTCGSADTNYVSVYVNATLLGNAAVSDCHDLTYVSELEECRTSLAAQFDVIERMTILNETLMMFFYMEAVYEPDQCTMTPSGCWINPDNPLVNSTCSFNSTNGHRTCECPVGFKDAVPVNASLTYIPGTNCTDIDECIDNTTCTAYESSCENMAGSFKCVCNYGFIDVYNDGSFCNSSVNECLLPIAPICDDNALCTTLDSGDPRHTCTCNSGFSGSGETCTDVNECMDPTPPCGDNATCTNTEGSFECSCDNGTIMETNGACTVPPVITPCNGPDPIEYDRKVLWGQSCSVAILLNCTDNSGNFDNGERLEIESTTNAECVNDQLVSTLPSDYLVENRGSFTGNRGRVLLNAQVACTGDEFSIKFDRTVANLGGFHLGNLFLGGFGNFETVEAAYGGQRECRGQPWYQDGIQYKFGVAGGSSACGTRRRATRNRITYTNVVRGRLDGGSDATITRRIQFKISFNCVFSRRSNSFTNNFFVFFRRTKRDVEMSASIVLPDKQVEIEMALYKDRGLSEPYSPTMQLNARELIYVDVSLPTDYGGRFEVQILRCWQTATRDGRGDVFKTIISNGCEEKQFTQNGNVLLPSPDGSSVRFGFPVKSIEGNSENIYVSCMLDVLDKISYSDFDQRCNALTPNPSTFRADIFMKVVTVGPVSVRDVCGGTHNGGCQQSCSVTPQHTPLCYCLSGFEVDSADSTQCRLSNPVSPIFPTQIYWYYYVIPLLILFLLIALIGLAIYKVKKSRSSHSGKYVLKEAEEASTSEEPNSFLH